MITITIKQEFAAEIVGVNGSGRIPLGKKSQKDLLDIAILAHKNKNLKRFFESLPPLEKLMEAKGEKFINENPVIDALPPAPENPYEKIKDIKKLRKLCEEREIPFTEEDDRPTLIGKLVEADNAKAVTKE